MDKLSNVYEMLKTIKITDENKDYINEIEELLNSENYLDAYNKMKELKQKELEAKDKNKKKKNKNLDVATDSEEDSIKYPKQLSDPELEQIFIGLLLENPKLISKYFFLFDSCYFEDDEMLNIYKSILFNEGSKYASEKAKEHFNFPKDNEDVYILKTYLSPAQGVDTLS